MSGPSIYVDANVFLEVLLREGRGASRDLRSVLGLIEAGLVNAYTSTLTWDEVTWVVRKAAGRVDSSNASKNLLSFPNLRFVPVTEEILARAREVMEEFGVAPRDAIHCASAASKGVAVVVSDDSELDAVATIKRETPSAYAKRSRG